MRKSKIRKILPKFTSSLYNKEIIINNKKAKVFHDIFKQCVSLSGNKSIKSSISKELAFFVLLYWNRMKIKDGGRSQDFINEQQAIIAAYKSISHDTCGHRLIDQKRCIDVALNIPMENLRHIIFTNFYDKLDNDLLIPPNSKTDIKKYIAKLNTIFTNTVNNDMKYINKYFPNMIKAFKSSKKDVFLFLRSPLEMKSGTLGFFANYECKIENEPSKKMMQLSLINKKNTNTVGTMLHEFTHLSLHLLHENNITKHESFINKVSDLVIKYFETIKDPLRKILTSAEQTKSLDLKLRAFDNLNKKNLMKIYPKNQVNEEIIVRLPQVLLSIAQEYSENIELNNILRRITKDIDLVYKKLLKNENKKDFFKNDSLEKRLEKDAKRHVEVLKRYSLNLKNANPLSEISKQKLQYNVNYCNNYNKLKNNINGKLKYQNIVNNNNKTKVYR